MSNGSGVVEQPELGHDRWLSGSGRGSGRGNVGGLESAYEPVGARDRPEGEVLQAYYDMDPAHEPCDMSERCLEAPATPSLMKWLAPVGVFLAAFFVQNAGLYTATYEYVRWIDLNDNLATAEGVSAISGGGNFAHKEALPDSFADFIGPHNMVFFEFVSSFLPVVWICIVLYTRNLRLWSRTLLAASILAVFKGFLTIATIVPDATGWRGCEERLGLGGLTYLRWKSGSNFAWVMESFINIIWLTLKGLFKTGTSLRETACADVMFSSQSYFCTLVSVSLYDATRRYSRHFKADFRMYCRAAVACFLVFINGMDIILGIGNRYHYTMDVVLAVVISLLVYSNHIVALCAEHWQADNRKQANSSDCDIIVAPCCLPFCCLQGRYYLYSSSAAEAAEAMTVQKRNERHLSPAAQNERKRISEEHRLYHEESARRISVLQKRIDSERERSKAQDAEATAAAQVRLRDQIAEAEQQFQMQLVKGLANLNLRVQAEKSAAMQWENKAATHMQRYEKIEEQNSAEHARLLDEQEIVRREADEQRKALEALQSSVAGEACEVEAMRHDVDQLGARVAARDLLQDKFDRFTSE